MKGIIILSLIFLLAGCGGRFSSKTSGKEPVQSVDAVFSGVDEKSENFALYREEAARIAASLEDHILAAQVLLTGIDGREQLSGEMESLLRAVPAGGIMLFRYNLNSGKDEVRLFLQACSDYAASVSGIVPFLAVDHEGGLVHRFGEGVVRLPPAASFWDKAQDEGWEAALDAVETSARLSALEIRELGITMNLAPVAEVLNEENALFLDTRSYGPDAGFVYEAVSAFFRGMEASGIACVLKHFPGNSGADPHFHSPVLDADEQTLDAMIEPFSFAVKELRPSALMVSHVLVPALDDRRIASLSPRILGGWLRNEIGFEGIIMADDFSMAASSGQGLAPPDAAVEALIAGADMVMVWPFNAREVHANILAALNENRLSRQRLTEAAGRILAEKLRYGLLGTRDRGSGIRDRGSGIGE